MNPLAVLFALPVEAAAFLKVMDSHWRVGGNGGWSMGYCGGAHLYVGVSGIGPQRASTKVRELLRSQHVSSLVFAGFAGALEEDLSSGDVVVADTLIDGISWPGVPYTCDPGLFQAAAEHLPEDRREGSQSRILTMDRLIWSHKDKLLLAQRYACAAVDMESAAAAAAAAEFDTAFIAVRSIVDCLDETLPSVLVNAPKPDGLPSVINLAQGLLRHPSDISAVMRLAGQARKAGKSLGRFLREYVPRVWEESIRE